MVVQHIKAHNGGLTIPRDNGQYEYLTTLAGNEAQHATEGNRAIAATPSFAGHCGVLHSGLVAPPATELTRVC
jgi:hypothetical protein